MCALSEQDKCAVETKVDELSSDFKKLEATVSKMMMKLDGHDKIIRYGAWTCILLVGMAIGSGLIEPRILMKFLH